MTNLITNMGEVSPALWDAAADAVNFVMTTPLAQVTVIVGIISIGCGLACRFIFGH